MLSRDTWPSSQVKDEVSDILTDLGNVSVDEFEKPNKDDYTTYLPEREELGGFEEMFRQLK